MADQKEFFKEGSTSLGTFYPTHYIIAGYHDMADAKAAAVACEKAGFASEDVRASGGDFMMRQLESRDENSSLLDRMGQELVKFAGTEQGYVREDAELARAGGAFLAVYAPNDEDVEKVKDVFARHGPAYARRYLKIAIEVIIRNPNAP
ncbi:MAG: hypothetical protein ACREP2_05755 [Rhodanobacteraceae bacterium]